MKRLSFTLSCLFFLAIGMNFSSAQTAAVKFEVKIPSSGLQKDSSVFLAGSFNCWNPQDSMYLMNKIGDDIYSLTVPLFDDKKYEYKYTLGGWSTVETAENNNDINNRQMVSHDGLTIVDTVVNWKAPEPAKQIDSSLMLSKEQLDKLSNLKDEMGKNLESRMKNFTGLLKDAFKNMLSQKPDMKLKKKYHREMVAQINHALDMAADAIWKVSSVLTPEQKKAILEKLNNSNSDGDIFSIMSKALSQPNK